MRRPSVDPADPEQCYESALRSLTRRFHGEAELRKKLAGKGFLPGPIDEALDRLSAERWIDDRRFAVAFASERLRKHIGPARVIGELRARGIEPAVATAATREAASDEEAGVHLQILCARKLASLVARRGREALVEEDTRNKLIAFLLKQGYEYGDAGEAVEAELRRARNSMKD